MWVTSCRYYTVVRGDLFTDCQPRLELLDRHAGQELLQFGDAFKRQAKVRSILQPFQDGILIANL